jgi:ribosomal protein S18 acetylase RimI-like enzyme
VQVRRARPGDAAAIAEVHARTWQAAYEHVFGPERLAERRPDVALWTRILANERVEVNVAEAGEGRIVAFVSVGPSRDEDAEGELYAIYALPEVWGTGAGPALMHVGVEAMRAAGYRDAILYVLDDNPRARRFYEREGWALDGGTKREELLGVEIAEVRYRRGL